jgi:Family of unknown function (DUF5677)
MDDISKTKDPIDRELLLKAHEICCETLRSFCAHFNERLPLADLSKARISILLATAAKAINTSNAIRMLFVERPYFEEMNVLVRSLIESIVNGAFIQVASDDEVNAFMHFDSISLSKALRIAQGVSPEALNILSDKLRNDFRAHTDSIKAMLGKDEQDFNWTRLDVVSKGKSGRQSVGGAGLRSRLQGSISISPRVCPWKLSFSRNVLADRGRSCAAAEHGLPGRRRTSHDGRSPTGTSHHHEPTRSRPPQ